MWGNLQSDSLGGLIEVLNPLTTKSWTFTEQEIIRIGK